MHVIGKDWLYTKLVDAADAAGMPDPLAWSGEQLRIIVANDPNSKAHPLAVEALQNTPAARWAVPGGGRFAGGIEGAEPANRVIPAPEAGTETPLAMVPNPTIGVKGKAPAPRRPVGPGLPPPPAAGDGRPGAIPPAAPRGPAPNADPRKPPAPGMSRIATKGGKYVFDGEIESYDPKTNSVKVRTSTGQRVSIDYDSLDRNSLRQFRGRVGEHNERVAFEDEKEDYDKKHGIGAYDNRFAPETSYPEHSGPDGKGGARLAARRGVERDAALKFEVDKHNKAMLGVSAEPGPVADVPPKAKQAAEQAAGVAAPAAQPARQQEPAHITEARERNAQQARVDKFTTRVYNEWQKQADEQYADQRANGVKDEDIVITPPPPSVVAMMDRKYKSAVMQYRRHVGAHIDAGVSLQEFAESQGVDFDVVSDAAESAGERTVATAHQHHLRTTEAANRHRESRMAPESRAAMHRKEAQAILRNPESTPAQRAHAYTLAGEHDMAQTELNAHAATEAARHQAAAEAARAGGRVREEEKEPDSLTVSVYDAVDSLPPGSSFDTMIAAGQHALESQGMADPKDPTGVSRDRVISVLGDRAWQRLAGGTIAPGSAEAYYFWRIVIGRQAEVESAKAANATPPPPLSKNEFVALASTRRVKEQVAAKWYDRFRGASSPATEVGTDDSAAVE